MFPLKTLNSPLQTYRKHRANRQKLLQCYSQGHRIQQGHVPTNINNFDQRTEIYLYATTDMNHTIDKPVDIPVNPSEIYIY